MKSVTFDFDVITDTPAPKRRAPEPAQPAPQQDAEKEQLRGVKVEQREHIRAAE